LAAHDAWTEQSKFSIPAPQRFYSSPLSRAAATLNFTFPSINALFLENLRESIGLHTCDQRRSKTYLSAHFPNFSFQNDFCEDDELWGPVWQETAAQQRVRVRGVLDFMWDEGGARGEEFVSITAHGGTVAGILDNIGHRTYNLQTGGVLPVVVRGTKRRVHPKLPLGFNAGAGRIATDDDEVE
jgi:broad specificity phosphatase PhoE